MSRRMDRFKRLEAPRTERGGDDAAKKTEERFTRMEKERAPGEAPPPPPRRPASRMERQVSDQPLALDTRSKAEQQFIRCMCCEADNSRYAQVCIHCGAPLQTDEQRDYNEQFWRQRQADVAQEQQAVEQMQAHKKQLTKEQAEAQAEVYAAMVREAQGGGDTSDPPGIRIIRGIESTSGRVMAVIGFVVLGMISFGCLAKWQPGRTWLGVTGLVGVVALAILFLPPGIWTARRRRSFWNDDW